ncbi:MAG: PAS domain S-box protein [Spirochaetota bacterium]|nr:MAG: PAS domain S-box protein [Spirochaetota bacterium]
MTIVAIIIKIVALTAYAVLALLTLKSKTEINVRRFFFVYLFGMTFWQFTSLMVHFATDANKALFWYKLLLAGFGLQTILFFPFTKAFLNIKKQKNLTYIAYFWCIVLLVYGLTGIGYKAITIGKGGYYVPEYSIMLYPVIAVGYFFWGFGVFNLVRGLLREQSPLGKNRIRYPLLGALIVIVGTASNLTHLQDYPVDIVCNLINAMLIGYAVIRYRLLDIRIALKRSALYIISVAAIFGTYILGLIGFQHLFRDSSSFTLMLTGFHSLIIVILIFLITSKRKAIQNFLNSLLHREKLTYQGVLENFSRRANSILDTELLTNLFVRTVFDTMKVNCTALMLFDEERREYITKGKQCIDEIKIQNISLNEYDPLVQWMKSNGKPLWKEEIRIDPQYSQLIKESSLLSTRADLSLIVPIIYKEEVTGLLTVGEKISGELYNDDDISFLTTIANLTATAIANSLAYKEVERRLSEQTLLFVLSKALGRAQKFGEMMESVLKILIYFLNLDCCAIISFSEETKYTAFFSSGIGNAVKKEIEQLGMRINRDHESIKRDKSGILLDVKNPFKDHQYLDEKDRKILTSSLFAVLEQNNEMLGLLFMTNWLGSKYFDQKIDILRTILAIVSQGIMLHKTFADLVNMKSYSDNVINSISTMGDMLIVFGFDGKIRRVNSAVCDLLGFLENELVGKDIGIIIPTKKRILNKQEKGKPVKNFEMTIKKKNDESVFVLFSSTIMEDHSGETKEIVGIARDITDIKATEEKYKTLFEEVKDVVFTCNVKGEFLDINPAGVELFGYNSKEDLLEIDPQQDLFFTPSDYNIFYNEIRQQEYIRNHELNLKDSEGREINVIVTANAIKDTNGEIMAFRGIMKDVTEERALHQQLIQAQKMESLGTLAGGVAHDFNNIMCAILGYASIMKLDINDDHPFYRYLDTIESSASRAAVLTNQLLAFARAGGHNRKVIDINTIVRETINLIKETFDRSIEIKSRLHKKLPSIEGDINQIQQVIMNLCVNARDAMPDGGILTIKTDVKKITSTDAKAHLEAKEGGYVSLIVSDTGTGINESILERIFDPFFTTKGPGEGTGLGLSVVYGVVKNHGGYIDAKSTTGKGTVFDVFFPVVKKSMIDEPEEEIEPPVGDSELILIVDDEKSVRDLGRDILEKYGYETLQANDGEEAIRVFTKNQDKISLIIIDMIMPKLGGMETYQRLKGIDPSVKALLLTGYNHTERVQEILDSGVRGFIKKPYNINELLTKVRYVLDS